VNDTDTELHPLLAAIKAEPRETARWLVWADHLDETGQDALARAWRWIADAGRYPHRDGWYAREHASDRPEASLLSIFQMHAIYHARPGTRRRSLFETDPFLNLVWLAEAVAELEALGE
jgi:uncharacterized protein (TIGR02996 family)